MEIGSHTFEHETLSLITADEIISTMSKNDKLLDNLIGFVPEIMRPTGGGVNDTVYDAVDKPMIQWDVDTLDWQTKDPQSTLKASVEGVQDGSVILMHDLFEATADATELVVPALQEMGYKMVTVSELAAQYGYTLEPHKEYYDFYPKNSPDERIRELYSED
jgi:peptidoglycan/xylan/chitin deacetylase (PgdA/CDA1 family)